jgi:hypothetical protein
MEAFVQTIERFAPVVLVIVLIYHVLVRLW